MIDEADLEAAVAAGLIADETRLKLIAFARGRAVAAAERVRSASGDVELEPIGQRVALGGRR